MTNSQDTMVQKAAKGGIALALVLFASACVVAPREGYYDRDHHRYYHEHAWHECTETNRGEYCR